MGSMLYATAFEWRRPDDITALERGGLIYDALYAVVLSQMS